MSDKSLCLTPDEAESLLAHGKRVHNCIIHETGMQFGCYYDRPDAIAALRKAEKIAIKNSDEYLPLGHWVAVWKDGRPSFFAADKAKVKAFKFARAATNQ
jgi:hypothetical protein